MLIGGLIDDPHLQQRAVLVVDDDDDIRNALDAVLSAEGYDVVTAPDGRTALEIATRYEITLILLDICMPVMDGPEFIVAYTTLHGRRPPTLVVSAADDAASWAQRIGADARLDKPFDVDELLALVERYTGGPGRLH